MHAARLVDAKIILSNLFTLWLFRMSTVGVPASGYLG